jgi:hypothetical protein
VGLKWRNEQEAGKLHNEETLICAFSPLVAKKRMHLQREKFLQKADGEEQIERHRHRWMILRWMLKM